MMEHLGQSQELNTFWHQQINSWIPMDKKFTFEPNATLSRHEHLVGPLSRLHIPNKAGHDTCPHMDVTEDHFQRHW